MDEIVVSASGRPGPAHFHDRPRDGRFDHLVERLDLIVGQAAQQSGGALRHHSAPRLHRVHSNARTPQFVAHGVSESVQRRLGRNVNGHAVPGALSERGTRPQPGHGAG